MKTTLIVTTYNWERALQTTLESVKWQNELPHEVIVADDGSGIATKQLLDEMRSTFPVPLLHCWQEDRGFRAAMARNRAIAQASGEYIIIIDGDMVLSKTFIESHKRAARVGWFVQGGRVKTDKDCGKKIMESNCLPTFFTKGLSNRKNCIESPFLAKWLSYERNNDHATRSCNMAFWRADAIQVNGFNQDFIGWGREDSEFVIRMLNAGKKRLYLKFAGIAFHLYHLENSREMLAKNDTIYRQAIEKKLSRCNNGLDSFLENTAKAHPVS